VRNVETTVFLIRHGVTDWHRDQKVLGQRDVALNATGINQAQAAATALAGVAVGEVLASPLVRAVQTAEIIAGQYGIEVARDPRLTDFRVGKWEGMNYEEVSRSPEYQRFIHDPLSEGIPGGEDMKQIRERAVAAVEQALEDAPQGESVVIVTHAGIVRVLLTYYLGSHPANYHRLLVTPGSISVLSFADDRELPRVLAVNWLGGLKEILE
jgi:broad specificity phosphatase PhoE